MDTILVAITHPGVHDADPIVAAEMVGRTRGRSHSGLWNTLYKKTQNIYTSRYTDTYTFVCGWNVVLLHDEKSLEEYN